MPIYAREAVQWPIHAVVATYPEEHPLHDYLHVVTGWELAKALAAASPTWSLEECTLKFCQGPSAEDIILSADGRKHFGDASDFKGKDDDEAPPGVRVSDFFQDEITQAFKSMNASSPDSASASASESSGPCPSGHSGSGSSSSASASGSAGPVVQNQRQTVGPRSIFDALLNELEERGLDADEMNEQQREGELDLWGEEHADELTKKVRYNRVIHTPTGPTPTAVQFLNT